MTGGGETDVLIVGAGPVGLSMAIALRHLGVGCIVIEKHDTPIDFPRGRLITVRTMELMRRWGVAAALREAGLPPSDVAVFIGDNLLTPAFNRFTAPDPSASRTSPTAPLICFQNLTENILRDAAVEAGADIRYGWELADPIDERDCVTATIVERTSGDKRTLSAPWMVAADGAHSPIRSHLGIGRHGPGVVAHAVTIVIDTDLHDRTKDRASVLYRIKDLPGATIMAMDNDRRRWGLIYEYEPAVDAPESFNELRFHQLAQKALGDPTVEFSIAGYRFWESTALVADQFRLGRVLLAGDAAHVTTPIGGLGMNCGIADVDNLAWKLAGVIAGWADESVLDTYETERRPVAEQTVDASLGRARPPAPIEGLILGSSYTSSAVCPDGTSPPEPDDPLGTYIPTARPGHRAPHLWLDDTHTRSTLDLYGDKFVLLTTPHGAAWRLAADNSTGIPIGVTVIDHPDWAELYGIGPRGAVLIRPDGYVAWRAHAAPAKPTELADALSQAVGHS